jgi:hypothetical protein
LRGGATGHRRHEIGGTKRAAAHDGSDAAVAQDRAAVGERHDLFQPVRHINNAGALLLQAAQHAEQSRDLAVLQRSRRLVENEHAAAPPQRLGDGDDLLLGKAELPYRQIGIGRKVESAELRARLVAHARTIDEGGQAEQPPQRWIAELQILRDRQRRQQMQLLWDGGDAVDNRVVRARQAALPSADRHPAFVGPDGAAEDAH